jgi:hypothetical protein
MRKRIKGAKEMKGRPITGEEFERLLQSTAGIVGDEAAPVWKYVSVRCGTSCVVC